MADLPVPEDMGILIRIAHGLSVMIIRQGKFLCYDPNDHDRAAYGMWWQHSEDRLRDQWTEQLVAE